MKTKLILPILALMLFAFAKSPKDKIKIFIAGDSTASIKDKKNYPETGWGMPFENFWDSTVTVINKARNGRSTKSFIDEGLWKSIKDQATEGDYVIIQFGHNDEVPTKKTYTTEDQFTNYLKQYINETRALKATPILMTPVARRKFTSEGKIEGTHDVYSELVRKVAVSENVLFIDLDKKSQALYQQFGAENSKLLFNQLKPGEHPNYPDGKEDNTHFNELGARLIAQLILSEIKLLNTDLKDRIVKVKSSVVPQKLN
jgi:lysophospholipase L1-like esterase